jgi:hypothetical protein
MLAWLGGKRKLLEAAKAKGANSSGSRQTLKQRRDERSSAMEIKKRSFKRGYQHSTQQHLQDGPCSQRLAASNKRLRVANPSQSMDVLMCNGVQLAEMHVPAEPAVDAFLSCGQAKAFPVEGHATAAAAAAGAAPDTNNTTNHNSSSSYITATLLSSTDGAASMGTPGHKHPVPAAAGEPTAASLLAGSISPQAAAPPPPSALPIALTAPAPGCMTLTTGNNSTAKPEAAAGAGRCADWHALLLGTHGGLYNHKHASTQPAVCAYDVPQQQSAEIGADEVLQEPYMQQAAGARQQRGTQQQASFDLLFLQGSLA